jgi:hypothetical protein
MLFAPEWEAAYPILVCHVRGLWLHAICLTLVVQAVLMLVCCWLFYFLFNLVGARSPRFFYFYFALHEGCLCFCICDTIPLFSRELVPFAAVDRKSIGRGYLGAGLLFGGFWFGLVGAGSLRLFVLLFRSLHEGCSCYLNMGSYSISLGSIFPSAI